MSTHNAVLVDGVANGAISKGQFVKYASGGWVACSSAGEHADGIAFSDAVTGGPVCVQVGGIVLYKVGGSDVADGAKLATTTGGLAATATTGDYPRLIARGAGVAGSYASAYWYDGFIFDGT